MNVTRCLYAYRALDDLMLIYPLYNVLFETRGLSPFEVSSLLVIWSTTSIIAEVPSGALADRYSRRKLLIIGQFIKATGYGLWLFVPNYFGYAAGFILWGIKGALESGTFQALVYDELKKTGDEGQYAKVMGQSESFALIANFIATASASLVLIWGYGAILLGSIAALVVSIVPLWLLPEAKPVEKVEDEDYWNALKRGVREALAHTEVKKLIFLGAFIIAVYGSMEEYDGLFFKALKVSEPMIPLLLAMLLALEVAASVVAYRFENLREGAFLTILFVSGLLLAGAGYSQGIPGIGLLALYMFLIKTLAVVYDAKLQHNIVSDLRATITSVGGFMSEVISIGIYIAFGLVADRLGYTGAVLVSGLTVMAVTLLFFGSQGRMFRLPVAETKNASD